jgi:hypothetical protein
LVSNISGENGGNDFVQFHVSVIFERPRAGNTQVRDSSKTLNVFLFNNRLLRRIPELCLKIITDFYVTGN